ncbi:MAG: metal ABC transporter substrate-binding protein [Actinobacteria bacterium]|nr:metal ABC transporter substrate-binding protein [Actinomycetota bacterium]
MKKFVIGVAAAVALGLLAAFFVAPQLFGQNQTPTPNASPTLTRTGDTGKVSVVVSTEVWASITSTIGGDWVDVTTIVPANQDPHSYQASARDQLALESAELVIANGGGYDDFMTQLFEASENKGIFLKLAEGEHIHADEAHAGETHAEDTHAADPHDHANEHIWFDLTKTVEAADHIAESIIELRPEAKQDVTANLEFFKSEMANIELRVEALRERAQGAGFIASEGVANLLLEHAGFQNLTPEALADAIEEERDVPVAALDEAEKLLKNKVAAILVVNIGTQDPTSDRLKAAAEAGNRPIVSVAETPTANALTSTDYLDWLNHVVDQLQEAVY